MNFGPSDKNLTSYLQTILAINIQSILYKRSNRKFKMTTVTSKAVAVKFVKKFIESTSSGFNHVLNKMKVTSAGEGRCTAELKVSEEDSNHVGTLHGGLSATLIDCISSCAAMTDKSYPNVPVVSVNMNISYLKGAAIGEEIVIDASSTKVGKTMGFLICSIKNKKTGDILVEGTHTVYFVPNKKKTKS